MNLRARVVLIVVAMAGMVLMYFATGWRDITDWTVCEQEHAVARSTADSAQIDLAPARRERGRGEQTRSTMLTCGEYRRQHQTTEKGT